MSKGAILGALANERQKLIRQETNHEETIQVGEILGKDAKFERKLERQVKDIAQTKENIKKLEQAANKK